MATRITSESGVSCTVGVYASPRRTHTRRSVAKVLTIRDNNGQQVMLDLTEDDVAVLITLLQT